MKIFFSALIISLLTMLGPSKTIYEFKVIDIESKVLDWQQFKGKKVMIVNTASKCGLTPQYEKLQALYLKYKNQGFEIIGFPANDFMGQEPGTEEEIAAFCQKNYGVSFTMMSKVTVKGKGMHPLFTYLTTKSENGVSDEKVSWNFQKFLINENGQLEKVIAPKVSPLDEEIIQWIEKKGEKK